MDKNKKWKHLKIAVIAAISIVLFHARLPWAATALHGHESVDCIQCHKADNEGNPQKSLIFKGKVDQLCIGCHKDVMIHPVGMRLTGRPVLFSRLMKLPLGKKDHANQVICTTCHYVHFYCDSPYLLREPCYVEEEFKLPISGAVTICDACHFQEFLGHDPHAKKQYDCMYCHLVKPERVRNSRRLREFLGYYSCKPCHTDMDCEKNAAYNPYNDPLVRKQAQAANVALPKGHVVCSSCHDSHATLKGGYFLRKAYLDAIKRSRSVNPHWNALFCASCHRNATEPSLVDEANATLLTQDFNRLCERCHDNRFARVDIHMVGKEPKHVKIPEDMPLQNGILTCLTCHDVRLQCGLNKKRKKNNPMFLRRDGLSRYEFCFTCHEATSYKRLNPHKDQLDKEGHIVKDKCLLCHSSVPDVLHTKGPSTIRFSVRDPNECCRGCHPDFYEFHPAGVTHINIKPPAKIQRAIDTSIKRLGVEVPLYNGRIICATCHNPHQKGVIKFRAASFGSTRPNRLRLPNTTEMCVACHIDKAYGRQ